MRENETRDSEGGEGKRKTGKRKRKTGKIKRKRKTGK